MHGVALIGRARSGKDTAAGVLAEYGFVRLALADPLKVMAYHIDPMVGTELLGVDAAAPLYLADAVDRYGWERVKDEFPQARRFLQRLGTEGVRRHVAEDFWITRCVKAAAASQRPVVVTDVRFDNEVAVLREAGFTVWFIDRGAPDGDHPSEQLGPEHADQVIANTGSLADFHTRIREALEATT
ncbi:MULTISPECIES: deoxynucleotide monophosphate kinase family protein [unclassified Kitasatospora]|uniref:deoxynucleotide monophosphate kinase family protein n=1 Tax=Kitasatospora sp. NPDC001261 TaxID=3364012 RepID=UPI00367587A8